MKTRILWLIFLLAAVLFGVGIFLQNPVLKAISKPVPLLVVIILMIPRLGDRYNRLILTGFVFSLLGDIFLMQVIDYFILGLLFFLVAHIFFISAFTFKSPRLAPGAALVSFAFTGGLFWLISPRLDEELFIPVLVYAAMIGIMVWRSFAQWNSDSMAIFAFFGAVLFAISDSLIAINRFYASFALSAYFIMATYWAAQFLIYKSAVGRHNQ